MNDHEPETLHTPDLRFKYWCCIHSIFGLCGFYSLYPICCSSIILEIFFLSIYFIRLISSSFVQFVLHLRSVRIIIILNFAIWDSFAVVLHALCFLTMVNGCAYGSHLLHIVMWIEYSGWKTDCFSSEAIQLNSSNLPSAAVGMHFWCASCVMHCYCFSLSMFRYLLCMRSICKWFQFRVVFIYILYFLAFPRCFQCKSIKTTVFLRLSLRGIVFGRNFFLSWLIRKKFSK